MTAGRQADRSRKSVIEVPGSAAEIETLGIACRDAGDHAGAGRWLRRALAADPGRTGAEAGLSLLAHRGSDWTGARRHGRRALALDPILVEAAGNLAATFLELGETEGAALWLCRAIALAPHWFAPHANLGNALRARGLFRQAKAAFRRSLALAPRSAPVWANLAQAEQDTLCPETADLSLRRALALASHPAVHSNLVFLRTYREDVGEAALFETVRQWAGAFTRPAVRPPIIDRDPARRIRVGYVSADFRSHPVGWNMIGLIEHHDPAQVETVAYSAVAGPDGLTRRFRSAFAQWRDIAAMDDRAVAGRIADDRIDILVILAGHTSGNRLSVAGHRAAPLQVSMYDLTSSGVDAVDYWLTDPVLSPPANKERFVETLVRLPSLYLHMTPSSGDLAPTAVNPPSSVIFGCCNNPAKLGASALRLWAKILNAVPGSRLAFRYFRHFATEEGQEPIVAALRAHGIGKERLLFDAGRRERDDQLRHLASIDVMLDPFPFNGATTTFEALWMGIPVVTLAGSRFVGRVAEAHLRQVGLGDLVATSEADYVRIAVELAARGSYRADLRRGLRDRVLRSPLCDAPAYARNVERAYREMWRGICAGRPWDGVLA